MPLIEHVADRKDFCTLYFGVDHRNCKHYCLFEKPHFTMSVFIFTFLLWHVVVLFLLSHHSSYCHGH